MIKKLLFIVVLLAMVVPALLPQVAMAQSTIDGTIDTDTLNPNSGRISFYAAGLQWGFFLDTDNYLKFTTSDDNGVTWATPTNITNKISATTSYLAACNQGTESGGYVHLTWYSITVGYTGTRYMRGQFFDDGTISWGTNWQAGTMGQKKNIAVDSTGYPWIGYGDNGAGASSASITKSSTNDGTWVTQAGFPVQLDFQSDVAGQGFCIPVPLTDGKLVAIFSTGQTNYASERVYARRWDGSNWGSVVASNINNFNFYTSAVGEDDYAHVITLERSTYDIEYMKYSYSTNTFGSYTTLYSAATSTSAPVITRCTDDNSLHVFWENDPVDDHIYYMTKQSGYAWSDYYNLVTEIDLLPANGYYLNSHYTCPRENLGLFYIAGTAILKFKLLGEQFEVSTLSASGVGDAYATLGGEIESLSFGSADVRGFYLSTSGNLTGAVEYSETGVFNVGVYNLPATELIASTDYYYIAFAENDFGTAYGEWVSFTTAFGMPTYLNAVPISSSEIALYWGYSGNVEGHCITIRRDTGGYPINMLDGTQVLTKTVGSETEDTHNNSGLASGTSYYYTLWLYDCNTGAAGGNASDWTTTFAAGTGGGITDPDTGLPYPVPEMPDEWFQEPSCAMYGQIPFMTWIDGVADSFSMPEESLCVAITFLGIIALSFLSFKLIPLGGIAVLVAGVLIVISSIAGAIPMYFIALGIVLMGGSLFLWHRT